MSLHQNSVPSYTHLVQSKLIDLARDHLSVLHQVALVSLTLTISHLPGKDRISPGVFPHLILSSPNLVTRQIKLTIINNPMEYHTISLSPV